MISRTCPGCKGILIRGGGTAMDVWLCDGCGIFVKDPLPENNVVQFTPPSATPTAPTQPQRPWNMSMFKRQESTTAYLKMGFMGFQGSGKTYTASDVAIGLIEMLKERGMPVGDLPAAFLDTEQGSDWVAPRFRAAGIELGIAKTRAFSDLLKAIPDAEQNASVLLIDSLTHYWVELCDTYMQRKNRTRLQFEDWSFLKMRWREFTDLLVNSKLHIIMCGRAGYEYDYVENDDTHKKDLVKTGIKMKAEGETSYEPSLLVLMEREFDMDTKQDSHVAYIRKDRSTLLDGKIFRDPKFVNFLPHINKLNLGGAHVGVDTSRNSGEMIPQDIRDSRSMQRKIALDDITDLLVSHFPGQSATEKKQKVDLLRKHFQAGWAEMEGLMKLENLRSGYDNLYRELVGAPSKYADADSVSAAK